MNGPFTRKQQAIFLLHVEVMDVCELCGINVEAKMTYFDVWDKVLEQLDTPVVNKLIQRFELERLLKKT